MRQEGLRYEKEEGLALVIRRFKVLFDLSNMRQGQRKIDSNFKFYPAPSWRGVRIGLHRKAGFTLIETSIALLILAVVITSLLLSFYRCLSVLQTSRDINIALSDLRQAAEDLREDIDNDRPLQYIPQAPFPHISNEQITVNANTVQNPVPVTVTVSWQEGSQRQRAISMDMLLTRRRK